MLLLLLFRFRWAGWRAGRCVGSAQRAGAAGGMRLQRQLLLRATIALRKRGLVAAWAAWRGNALECKR